MHSRSFEAVSAPVTPMSIRYPKRWQPQPDITIYELALCMPIVAAISTMWRVDIEQMIGSLPVEARRHFATV